MYFECEGIFLLDGVCEEEASVAAVVCVSVFSQHIGEIQVPVQTHGHTTILGYRHHGWRREVEGEGEKARKILTTFMVRS